MLTSLSAPVRDKRPGATGRSFPGRIGVMLFQAGSGAEAERNAARVQIQTPAAMSAKAQVLSVSKHGQTFIQSLPRNLKTRIKCECLFKCSNRTLVLL